jgi:DNA-3-methyladenine glycosylase I
MKRKNATGRNTNINKRVKEERTPAENSKGNAAEDTIKRCFEGVHKNQILLNYHDEEWGVPLRDDHKLFEHLTLSVFQAGLTFNCVLTKREAMRTAFEGFDPVKVAAFDQQKITQLVNNASIIRNKSKITSTVKNAQLLLKMQEDHGSFHEFIWQFVGGRVIDMKRTEGKIPATSTEAEELSKALKKKGFKFVGPTIIYAFMNEVGMVNNHMMHCFRYQQCLSIEQ